MWILTTHLDLLLYRLMHTVSLQSLNFYDPNHHYPNPWCRTGYEVLLSCLKQDFEKDHNKQQLTSSSLFVIDTRFDRLAWNCQHNAEYHIFILAIVLSLNQACSGHNGMSCPLSVWFWFIFLPTFFFPFSFFFWWFLLLPIIYSFWCLWWEKGTVDVCILSFLCLCIKPLLWHFPCRGFGGGVCKDWIMHHRSISLISHILIISPHPSVESPLHWGFGTTLDYPPLRIQYTPNMHWL